MTAENTSSTETTAGQASQPVAPSPAPLQLQPSPPELPGMTDEPPASPTPAGKNSLRQKILGKIGGIAERHGLKSFIKGKGRPKNCPACGGPGNDRNCEVCGGTGHVAGKGDTPLGDTPAAPAVVVPVAGPAASPAPSVPALAGGDGLRDFSQAGGDIFRRAILGGIKGFLGGLGEAERIGGKMLGLDPSWCDKAVTACKPDGEAMQDFEESFRLVAEKRGWNVENSPEWSLAINGGRLLVPHGLLAWEMYLELKGQREARAAGVKK